MLVPPSIVRCKLRLEEDAVKLDENDCEEGGMLGNVDIPDMSSSDVRWEDKYDGWEGRVG